MEPNLLVGDRLFVSKYTYGYSRHSLPFSPNFTNKRFFKKKPEVGDVIVFKTPSDDRTDYIKRLVAGPGDTLQFIDGSLFINNKEVSRKILNTPEIVNCGDEVLNVTAYEETLENGKKYVAVYNENGTLKNSNLYNVPANHYFFMGDNRDCSKDSRFLGSVGYVNFNNLVGKARIIFFSNDKDIGNFFQFWKWNKSIRVNRFLNKIK